MSPAPIRIFIVEDEALIAMELGDRLAALGYTVCGQAARGEQALVEIPACRPDLVLMDIKLAGVLTGIETASCLRSLLDVPVVFLSAFSDSTLVDEAVRTDSFGYLVKPFEERELHATIQAARYKHKVEQLLRNDKDRLEAIVQERSAALWESEAQLRDIFDGTSDLIQSTDADGRLLLVNRAWRETLGYTAAEATQMSFLDAIADERREHCATIFRRLVGGEEVGLVDVTFRKKDGGRVVVEGRVNVRIAEGRVVGTRGIFRDVTERKAAEAEVRRLNANLELQVRQRTEKLALSEERFRRLAENMRDLLCMIDAQGRFVYVSPSFRQVLGYAAEDLLGEHAFAAVHAEDRARAATALELVLAGGPAPSGEFRYRHQAGHFVWLEGTASVVRAPGGEVSGCVVSGRDITERKDAAERLRDSEQRYAQLVENVHDAIIRDDADGRLVFANRRFLDWFGLAGRELQSITLEDYVAPEWRAALRDRHDRRQRGERVPERFEYEGIRADSRRMWLDVFVTPVLEQGRITGTQSVMRDITARKQAEQASQAVLSKTAAVVGEAFYRELAFELGRALDVALVCIVRVAAPGRLKPLAHYADGQMHALAEFAVPAGHPCGQVLAGGEPFLVSAGFGASAPAGFCGRTDLEGFSAIPLRVGSQPEGLLIIGSTRPLQLEPLMLSLLHILAMRTEAEFVREQSELEQAKMQSRLFQSQKYEALGTLAGGVAHDFNNILTGVINYTSLAREDCPPTHPQIREFLGEVLACGNRAKELVHQILLFSRAEEGRQEPVQFQAILKEALALLRSTLPATTKIEADIDHQARPILANATQLHQVVMNLAINASHSLKGQPGRLSLRLRPHMIDEAAARALPDLKPGPHLRLEVTDTGCGMDETVLARIFEPFFTTKSTGEGTGLGLAVVHSVVRSHRGAITVRSQPGAGTTFELFFPLPAPSAPAAASKLSGLACGHGEHIFLVDDERTVAQSMKLLLERLGYRASVFTATEQALAQFWINPNAFDAAIVDYQMPGMTGVALAKRLISRRPGLPVLMASGFAGSLDAAALRAFGIAGLIQKPILLEQLASALVRVLPKHRGSGPPQGA